MSRKAKLSGMVIGLVMVMGGTAAALLINFTQIGTIGAYDFGAYGPGYPVPGSLQFQVFTMQPGDSVPFHYHKGVSYVILVRGTLTEQHLVGPDQCAAEQVKAGDAFVETPGLVHTVKNTGNDAAVIWWATLFPKSDGPGGIYFVDPPPKCQ